MPTGSRLLNPAFKMPLIPGSFSKQQTLPHFAGLQCASRGMRERTFHLLPKEWGPTCCCPDGPNSSSGGTGRWSSAVRGSGLELPAPGLDLGWFSVAPSLDRLVPRGSGGIGCLSWDLSVLKSPDQLFYGDTDKFLLIIYPVLIDFLFFFFFFSQEIPVWQHLRLPLWLKSWRLSSITLHSRRTVLLCSHIKYN